MFCDASSPPCSQPSLPTPVNLEIARFWEFFAVVRVFFWLQYSSDTYHHDTYCHKVPFGCVSPSLKAHLLLPGDNTWSINTMARLPLEITDMIVDYLHKDRSSLATCSAVSKTLLPASRYHLFHRVKILNARVATFVDLLKSPLSTINGHIRFVHISGIRLRRFDLDSVRRIFALPAVRTLFLYCVNWESFPEATRSFLLTGLPKIITLKLRLVRFPVFSQFAGLLSACSSLQTLDVADISYVKMPSSVIPLQSNIHLRRLEIGGPLVGKIDAQMLRGFLALPNVCHLESFKYLDLHREIPQVWRFMQRLKPVLKDFVVSFTGESESAYYKSCLFIYTPLMDILIYRTVLTNVPFQRVHWAPIHWISHQHYKISRPQWLSRPRSRHPSAIHTAY